MLLLPSGPKPIALLMPSPRCVPHFIYMIHCSVNNKVYIGQTVNLKERWMKHIRCAKLPKGHVDKQIIHYGMMKHDINNFNFYLIEQVVTQEEANTQEIYWISYFCAMNRKRGYNRTEGGLGPTGFTPWNKDKKIDLIDRLTKDHISIVAAQLGITTMAIHARLTRRHLTYTAPQSPSCFKSGEAHIRAKLTKDNVLEIVKLYNTTNMTQQELGTKFNIKRETVSGILRGINWSNITGIKSK